MRKLTLRKWVEIRYYISYYLFYMNKDGEMSVTGVTLRVYFYFSYDCINKNERKIFSFANQDYYHVYILIRTLFSDSQWVTVTPYKSPFRSSCNIRMKTNFLFYRTEEVTRVILIFSITIMKFRKTSSPLENITQRACIRIVIVCSQDFSIGHCRAI